MEPDDGLEEEGPFMAWLPPDDRLWRHPSEAPPIPPPESDSGRRVPLLTGLLSAHSSGTRIWTVAVMAGVIGALAASGLGMVSGVFEQQTTVVHAVMPTGPTETLASVTGPSTPTATSVDWTAVDDAVAPSVVGIDVSTAAGPNSGSGLLFVGTGSRTYVITDSALVAQAGSIMVSFLSGQRYRADQVKLDPLSGLALLAVPTEQPSFPQLGSVASLQLANPVLAVGARTADGAGAYVFPGSVTSEDREVDLAGGMAMQNLIAITGTTVPAAAAGGPLLDQQGQVVGITVSLQPTDTSDQALAFAVPVDVAVHVAQQMLAGTPVTHPWVGVMNAFDISSTDARQYGLSGGAQVGQVWPGSPVSRLGLGANDIVTALCDKPVTSTGVLTQVLSQCPSDKRAVIRYLHKGTVVQSTVYVSPNPPDSD
ncbi:MAG TPA: S1C family serine protease [Acidimicrobiales bacterium]